MPQKTKKRASNHATLHALVVPKRDISADNRLAATQVGKATTSAEIGSPADH